MSRKGENIYKRKDGRWEARYIKSHDENGTAQYGYCYASSYREVKEKVAYARIDSSHEVSKAVQTKNLANCCDEWLYITKTRVKDSTLVRYESNIRNHIKPKLGDCPIDEITSITIAAFTNSLLTDGLSPKSVRDILSLLRSILKYASKVCTEIDSRLEIVYPKESRDEMRVLTLNEQQTLKDYLLNDMDNCKFSVYLSMMTGLRIGEICALRWGDISLDKQTLRVGNAMQRLKCLESEPKSKTKVRISEPKSKTSYRTIPLTDQLIELCKVHQVQNPDAFVLTGSAERFMEPRTLQNRLKKYTAACGLEGVHFHTLRHSFATRCVEVDFEIKSLSEILGHSSPQITLERYVHSSMELKHENMKKLEKIG